MSGTDWFVLLALVGTLVFMGRVLWKAGIRSAKPGQVEVVCIVSGSKAEADLWSSTLSARGVRSTTVQAYDPMRVGEDPSIAITYDICVRPGDEVRARQVLGL